MLFKLRRIHLKWRILFLLDKWGIRHATVFELIEPVWPMKKSTHRIYPIRVHWDKPDWGKMEDLE